MNCIFRLGLLTIAGVLFISSGLRQSEAQTADAPRKITFSNDGFAPMFPFVQCKGAPDNITNVKTWRGSGDQIKPAGSDGFLKIENGHFVSESGAPVYFVGTNLCFSGDFPQDKPTAERLAKSLSRYGINCVRLHHMDSHEIWGNSPNHLTIDPEKLDRLDYMIYQFHLNGIYVNINLHVSRKFSEKEGFVNTEALPKQDKGIDNFEPKMIEYQKKYAKDLLTHVNPYTKKAYIDDPGVAMIEINNENSVVASWSWSNLDALPEPYCDTFNQLWNDWLIKKYRTTDRLKAAWQCRSYPIGPEMIADGNFAKADAVWNNKGWEVQLGGPADVKKSIYQAKEGLVKGQNVVKLEVVELGDVGWIPQLHRHGLAVEGGKPYTLRFSMRASAPVDASFGVRQDHDPWGGAGINKSIKLSEDWSSFEYSFIAPETDKKVRLSFSSMKKGVTYELAAVSMVEGGNIGLAEGESLEKKNLTMPKRSGLELPSPQAYADVAAFLYDLEDGYWQDMFKYVKSLGAKQPITGTQLQYGFWNVQAKMDYTDIHAYWNHPSFPGRPWDGNNWYVNSKSLVNSPAGNWSTLNRLATVRVLGSPMTVSEYDHPYPNLYCAEGLPMAYAMASFQDWAGIFQFAWKHDNNYEPQYCNSFFDMAGNQVKLAHLPACWAMICRNGVKKGPSQFVYSPEMSKEKELEVMKSGLTGYHRSLDGLGLDYSLALAVTSGIDLTDFAMGKSIAAKPGVKKIQNWSELPDSLGSFEKKWVRSDSGELYYNWEREGKGYFVCSAPEVKVFTGFIDGRQFDLGSGVVFAPGKTRLDWTTFSMVKADSNRYLLTATGLMANENMDLEDLGQGRITCGARWGKGPAICEGIPADLTVPAAFGVVKVYALDQDGNRTREVKVDSKDGKTIVRLDPEYKTIWYELDLR